MQNSDLALERLARLCISLENERALNDDPKWSGNKKMKEREKHKRIVFNHRRFTLCFGEL